MTENEKRTAAKEFANYWKDRGYEKGESQPFWLSLLRDVLGIDKPEQFITFENQVKIDNTSFIDATISATHVLIEQKSTDKDLRKPIKQADGSLLTPFQQAKRYSAELPYSERPRWIVTCNFREFLIYDMEKPTGDPESILLKDLPKEAYRLQFLVDTGNDNIRKEMEISIKAGEIVGLLYDEILKQYKDPEAERTLKSLNMLCVRLVFCLYAEDSGLFGEHLKFHNYIKSFAVKDVRRAIIDLFKVLDTKPEMRDPYLDEMLASFPYVNGGLFADEDIEIPQFNEKIVNLLLHNASENFDWSEISPTIFGAVFESTLNPETRRSGGMHYTSIENIHKVIDPLFLDELRKELTEIETIAVDKTRVRKLEEYRLKLATLTFLDPACGSGNFLTETYLSLRRLENEALNYIYNGQIVLGFDDLIKVSIGQFYGIEINDFAVTVAKTALWIAESQMMKETEEIVKINLEFLPLRSYANIVEGNALTLDWESLVPKDKLNYIMGNPPFVGGMMAKKEQKEDMLSVIGNIKGLGELDYVAAWYYKATKYIVDTHIEVAFVSTNSICQGQQAVTLWKPLFEKGVRIQFAHRSFIWDSEAKVKAHVHCVIVCFSLHDRAKKAIFFNDMVKYVKNINSYLMEAPDIFIESRTTPLCDVPKIRFGSMPRDGGGFILSDEEKNELIKKEPISASWIHPYLGAYEFINNKTRWCLWLVDATPHEIKQSPYVMKRIESVREFRANSVAAGTRKFAETPTLFCQIAQPDSDYIAVPETSSERRKYIPIGFLSKNVIASNLLFLIPNASLYHFGILTSNVHNAWMRTVCGRLKSDYRYAKDIVYNNFPWPSPTAEQKAKIEQTAQEILNARALYPDSSLADLYDELTMPVELRRAHQHNDKAVMQAYGFWGKLNTESECVAELMKMYQNLTKKI
ncbi:MAG TPA: class I SAM-dependent DNA methyltransferase [Candidatus Ornithoclostridium excrementipullorum]|nr:class I SAM-dependent DNA methyltransferase [Candidatus Ornithoclostridium excrementipullorum]